MKGLHIVSFILLIVGGLNWGLVAFGYNLVDGLLGEGSTLSLIVYGLVGLAAIVEVATHKKGCKACDVPAVSAPASTM